ncbi:MAG: O-antigen ligase family protein [Bacteroidales bacterium]|nr:O-antigen ligase family protein [Bacteroidales bacterium]
MVSNKHYIWVYLITFVFIAINALFISLEFFAFSILPLALLILVFAFFALDKLILLIVFLTPLSVQLKEFIPHLEFGMNLPTEPLLLGVMFIFFLKLIHEKKFDKKILYHPVSIAIYFNLFWIFITSITSTLPVVSFKFFISRLWFIIAFYFLATQLFVNIKNVKRYIWLFIFGFIIVIAYTLTRHIQFGLLNQKVAHWAPNPFFIDHTSYGAILAMCLPVLIGFAFNPCYSTNRKILIWLLIPVFIFSIVFSYTRATWISLIAAFFIWLCIKFKIKFRTLLLLGTILIIALFMFKTEIMINMELNKQDSSADFGEHVKSMSNISSDASNLERINRWNSALRMFKEKPVFGWGPGTYMFNYGPFQFSYEKTIISTNAGDMGNAHSEYIGPLSESGVLGMLTFIFIIVATIITALKVYTKSNSKEIKIICISALIGLITYYLHGFLNNFLDTDKASVPFWGFTAIIVALDVYHRRMEENKIEN